MFEFSGYASRAQFLIGGAVRCLVAVAGFYAILFIVGFQARDCSPSACAGLGMGIGFLLYLAATVLFALSMVPLSVRRARDAGWHPFMGGLLAAGAPPILAVLAVLGFGPLLIHIPFALLMPGWPILLILALIMGFAPSQIPRHLRRTPDRPPDIE